MSASMTIGGKTIEVASGQTIESAVRNAGMIPDAFLFVVNGKPVPMDTPITDEITIKALKVASGG
ncbi:MAG: hypothetical protein MJZ21_00330 [archaeon]|nr:hypothetical protein [archaeon]